MMTSKGEGNDVPNASLSEDKKVRRFFEDVDHTLALNQLSYTPHAPFYMESQYRFLASALRSAIQRWTVKGSLILDIGCGHGELLRPLSESYQLYGVDLSFGLLRAARVRGLRVFQCNANALPFVSDQFDVIVCAEVLQHVPDPKPLLFELARVCRPKGALIVSTLNKQSLLRKIFQFFSQGSRLASMDLPIIKRTVQEVGEAAYHGGWVLQDVCWVHSPTPFNSYALPPTPIRELIATNHISFFTK